MTAAGKTGLTRRHFIVTAAALFSPPVAGPLLADSWPNEAQKSAWDAQVTPPFFNLEASNPWGLDPRFLPQRVEARAGLVPGNIHVDAIARYLYHIEEGGTAMRYGVAIARGNLYEPGTYTIRRKVRWPYSAGSATQRCATRSRRSTMPTRVAASTPSAHCSRESKEAATSRSVRTHDPGTRSKASSA